VDADNKVRRDLLFVQTPQGEMMPSLGMYLALLYLEKEGIQLRKFLEQQIGVG
jgi:CHASE2 domain-containing sensor protein